MIDRICKSCNITFPLTSTHFPVNGRFFRTLCHDCYKTYQRGLPVSDTTKKKKIKYRQENREKMKEYSKQYYINNREKSLTQSRNRYQQNAVAICERTTAYRKANREWYNEYNRSRRDKLQKNIRRGMWGCLSGRQKTSSTFLYIGCSVGELWQHLISLFQPGMTIDNYGEWHVDHIRPLASFDFTGDDMEDQLHMAWHFSNLQPLWAGDNLSKSDSLLPRD